MERTLDLLEKIGMTESEAKVYLALVENGSMSGYEASKCAMVPRSKIYNVLESLVSKGYILFSEQDSGKRYRAVEIEEIASRVRRETEDTLIALDRGLARCKTCADMDDIWRIRGYDHVFNKCRLIIEASEKELLIQIWEEDLDQVMALLLEKEEAGLHVALVCFSENADLDLPFRHACKHGMLEQKKQDMGGRFVTIVSDGNAVVFGQIAGTHDAEVIWTHSRPMVTMASECVRHDLYFYRGAELMGPEMQEKLGKDYSKVREI